MKVIMVPVADRPECRIALEAAFALAAGLSSNVVGYHLRPHREERLSNHSAHLAMTVAGAGLPEPTESAVKLDMRIWVHLFKPHLNYRENIMQISLNPQAPKFVCVPII